MVTADQMLGSTDSQVSEHYDIVCTQQGVVIPPPAEVLAEVRGGSDAVLPYVLMATFVVGLFVGIIFAKIAKLSPEKLDTDSDLE